MTKDSNAAAIVKDILKQVEERKTILDTVFFIACGGSLAGIYPTHYLLDRAAEKINSRIYNAREFVLHSPRKLTEKSLVVACTLNGTPETLEAMRHAKANGAYIIAIVGENCFLSENEADYVLTFKTIADESTPMLETNVVLSLQVGFELLHQIESYPYYAEAVHAYSLLEPMVDKIRSYIKPRSREFAKQFADAEFLYVMAGAPVLGEAYAFCLCSLMEIQWIHSSVLDSAEFFHGSFEILDKRTNILQLIGDVGIRPADERATAFLQRMGKNFFLLDVKELFIDILPPNVKEYFQHTAFDAALRDFITEMAIERNHDKDVRRYMWKMEY